MVVFVTLAVVGFLLLVVSLVLDGVLETVDFGFDGVFSLVSLSSVVAAFGIGGVVGTSLGLGMVPTLLIGAAAGVGCGVFTTFLTKAFLKNEQAPTQYSDATMVGNQGTVVSSNLSSNGYGTVSVLFNDALIYMGMLCDEVCQKGDHVKIVSIVSNSTVKVEKIYSDFSHPAIVGHDEKAPAWPVVPPPANVDPLVNGSLLHAEVQVEEGKK